MELRISVKYYGFIEDIVGKEAEEFELQEDASIRALLNNIADLYGTPFIKELFDFDQKDLRYGFLCALNGLPIGQLDGINTKLRDGDKVVFISLTSGG
jgi:MoaD family protein